MSSTRVIDQIHIHMLREEMSLDSLICVPPLNPPLAHRNCQYGTDSIANDALRGATSQRIEKAMVPLRGQDNEIGLDIVGRV
jgi:hypothetical protein